jgi:hypothetical protein
LSNSFFGSFRPELHIQNFDIQVLTPFSVEYVSSIRNRRRVRITILGIPYKYAHICKDFKQKLVLDSSFFVLKVEGNVCNTPPHRQATTVELYFSLCTVDLEVEQEICRFARNPIKLRYVVMLASPRQVWKTN